MSAPDCQLLFGDVSDQLHRLPDQSIQCIVTSPPYWRQRTYTTDARELGREANWSEYIERLVGIFRDVKRVLRPDGTVFLNLGDTMVQKQALLIPSRVALALQADGWYLRQQCIWAKAVSFNPKFSGSVKPEPVRDRFVRSHEDVFLLTQSPRYFFDPFAIEEVSETGKHRARDVWSIPTKPYRGAHVATFPVKLADICLRAGTSAHGACSGCGTAWKRVRTLTDANRTHQKACGATTPEGGYDGRDLKQYDGTGAQTPGTLKSRILRGLRNFEDVWQPSCRCLGTTVVPQRVLDPFGGSGTTAEAAAKLGLSCTLIELNPQNASLIQTRLDSVARLF